MVATVCAEIFKKDVGQCVRERRLIVIHLFDAHAKYV